MKLALIAVIVLATLAIAIPIGRSVLGSGSNEATQLMEATERTTTKANSLNDSLSDIIPPAAGIAPANRAINTSQPISHTQRRPAISHTQRRPTISLGPSLQPKSPFQQHTPPVSDTPIDPNGPTYPQTPLPSPTPDKYAAYDDPADHAVKDALEYLNKLQTELEPSPTEYIQAVTALQHAWTPRFEKANEEYKRFAWRIDHANAMANEYFSYPGEPDQSDRQLL